MPGCSRRTPLLLALAAGVIRSAAAEGTVRWDIHGPIALVVFVLGTLAVALALARRQIRVRTRSLELVNAELAMAQRHAGLGSWTWDVVHNTLTWSDQMYILFGIDKKNFTGSLQSVIETSIHPEDRERVDASNRSVAEKGVPIPLEYRIVLPSGQVRSVWAEAGKAEKDAWGRVVRLSGYVLDLTERKRTEEELRRALDRNRVLMRELLHRTKNNMFLVSSMLRLRAEEHGDPGVCREFAEVGARIDALALVQESLYKSEDLDVIDFGDYLRRLVGRQVAAFVPGGEVRAEFAIDDLALGVQQASPLALALNELAINSLKHAFGESRRGTISVSGGRRREGNATVIEISYRDDGPGYPPGIDPERAQTQGLRLLRLIVREQLGGDLAFLPPPGAACAIVLRLEEGGAE